MAYMCLICVCVSVYMCLACVHICVYICLSVYMRLFCVCMSMYMWLFPILAFSNFLFSLLPLSRAAQGAYPKFLLWVAHEDRAGAALGGSGRLFSGAEAGCARNCSDCPPASLGARGSGAVFRLGPDSVSSCLPSAGHPLPPGSGCL